MFGPNGGKYLVISEESKWSKKHKCSIREVIECDNPLAAYNKVRDLSKGAFDKYYVARKIDLAVIER